MTSEYFSSFKSLELLIEYKNLSNHDHCPTGMYVVPRPDNLYEWHMVMFIHRGYYKEGIFKFIMRIPESYPDQPPQIQFITEMFHPLIDRQGNFNLRVKFPIWHPNQDYICHILHFVRDSFKDSILNSLEDKQCYNTQCYAMFKDERKLFNKLAAQCAQLSSSESTLFDQATPFGTSPVYAASTIDDVILFSQISDQKEQRILKEMFETY